MRDEKVGYVPSSEELETSSSSSTTVADNPKICLWLSSVFLVSHQILLTLSLHPTLIQIGVQYSLRSCCHGSRRRRNITCWNSTFVCRQWKVKLTEILDEWRAGAVPGLVLYGLSGGYEWCFLWRGSLSSRNLSDLRFCDMYLLFFVMCYDAIGNSVSAESSFCFHLTLLLGWGNLNRKE